MPLFRLVDQANRNRESIPVNAIRSPLLHGPVGPRLARGSWFVQPSANPNPSIMPAAFVACVWRTEDEIVDVPFAMYSPVSRADNSRGLAPDGPPLRPFSSTSLLAGPDDTDPGVHPGLALTETWALGLFPVPALTQAGEPIISTPLGPPFARLQVNSGALQVFLSFIGTWRPSYLALLWSSPRKSQGNPYVRKPHTLGWKGERGWAPWKIARQDV